MVPDVRKVGSVKRRCGGSCAAEWHAAVARSAFSSQNAQNTTFADQFLKLRRRLWREAIVKSKCAKHLRFGAIFEVSMWKNGTLLWREVQKLTGSGHFSKQLARRCGTKQIGQSNVQKPRFSGHFLTFRCRKMARRCGAICKSKCAKHLRFDTLWTLRCGKGAPALPQGEGLPPVPKRRRNATDSCHTCQSILLCFFQV